MLRKEIAALMASLETKASVLISDAVPAMWLRDSQGQRKDTAEVRIALQLHRRVERSKLLLQLKQIQALRYMLWGR